LSVGARSFDFNGSLLRLQPFDHELIENSSENAGFLEFFQEKVAEESEGAEESGTVGETRAPSGIIYP